jgi:hypothetical protein
MAPPKSRKDSVAAPVPPEDLSHDALLVVTLSCARLKLGLLAAPGLACAEPLQDAGTAPAMHLELHHNGAISSCGPAALSADFVLAANNMATHRFRHRKGPDVLDRILNAQRGTVEVRLVNSSSKVMLASGAVDLLPFGLGAGSIQDDALPLQPATTDEPFKARTHSCCCLSSPQAPLPHLH